MNIILKEKGVIVATYLNQGELPNPEDRIVLNPSTVFRVERRYIDYIKQEVVLEGFKFSRL